MNWIKQGYRDARAHEAAKSVRSRSIDPQQPPAIPAEIAPALQAALLTFAETDADFQLIAGCERNTPDRVGLALATRAESLIVQAIEPYVFKAGNTHPVIKWFNTICAEPGSTAPAWHRPLIRILSEALMTDLCTVWREEHAHAV